MNIKLVRYLAGLQEKKRSFRLEDFPTDFYSMEDLYALRDMGYLAIHETTQRSRKKEIDRIDLLRDIRPTDFDSR